MSSRLKIALVNQPWGHIVPPIQTGGSIPILLYELARRMAQNADVLLYTRGSFRKDVKYDQGVEYRYLPIVWDKAIQKVMDRVPNRSAPNSPRFAQWYNYAGYGLQLARDVRAAGCDVIHVVNLSQFVPVLRRYNPNALIVLHMHCEWLSQLDPALLEPRLAQTDLILGISDFITNKAKKAFPHLADRCRTLYNGVDHEKFADRGDGPANDPARELVYVGRVTPEKGVHTLIDAFGRIADRFPDLRLRIVGPFEINLPEMVIPICDDPKVLALQPWFSETAYRAVLEKMLTPAIRDRVEFRGSLPQKDLPDQYRTADLCAVPSVWEEPFGLPLIEAMSCGAPVVATLGGAFPEIVQEGNSGLLVERDDPAALAAALQRLAGDAALRYRIGRAARSRVLELFTWDRAADSLLGFYREALATRDSARPQTHQRIPTTSN